MPFLSLVNGGIELGQGTEFFTVDEFSDVPEIFQDPEHVEDIPGVQVSLFALEDQEGRSVFKDATRAFENPPLRAFHVQLQDAHGAIGIEVIIQGRYRNG